MDRKNYRLIQLRKEWGLTQEALGKEIGLSQSMIAHLEAGSKDTSRKYKLRLAHFFQVSVEGLFYEQVEHDQSQDIHSLEGSKAYDLSR